MGPKSKSEPEDDLERAPWEDGALTVDVTSVPADVVIKNCLSDDLPVRLIYIKGLASAATRASRRELPKLLEALSTLLEDEALGVRLETLQQLEQLAKLAGSTASPDDVVEAVVDALEQQIRISLDPGGGAGGGARQAGAGTGGLPMVREALLACLDSVCRSIGPGPAAALLLRLQRAANSAQDKPGGVGPAGSGVGGGGSGGSSKASGDAALMALSLAAVAVRHFAAERGGLAAAAMAGRLCRHGDIRVREAVAGALPQLYGPYAAHPGALDQLLFTYDILCQDKVWSVRQACARVGPELSQMCSAAAPVEGPGATASPSPSELPQKEQQQKADALQVRLLRLFLGTLLTTKSQWVVTAVRQQAGAVIATLRSGVVPELLPPLLEAYCGGAAAVGQGAVEVRRSCAESFAEVVAKAGPERWQAQLHPVFVRLLTSTDAATLSSLVASAERLVRILAGAGPPASPLPPPPSQPSTIPAEGSGSGGSAVATCAFANSPPEPSSSKPSALSSAATSEGPAVSRARLYDAARQVVSGPLLEVLRKQVHLVAPAASAAVAGLLEVSPPELQRELVQVLPELCAPPRSGSGRCGDWRPRQVLAEHLGAAMRAILPPPPPPTRLSHPATPPTAAAAATPTDARSTSQPDLAETAQVGQEGQLTVAGEAAGDGVDEAASGRRSAEAGEGSVEDAGEDSGGEDDAPALLVARCAATLCRDPVFAVRRTAAAQVGDMLVRCCGSGGRVVPRRLPLAAATEATEAEGQEQASASEGPDTNPAGEEGRANGEGGTGGRSAGSGGTGGESAAEGPDGTGTAAVVVEGHEGSGGAGGGLPATDGAGSFRDDAGGAGSVDGPQNAAESGGPAAGAQQGPGDEREPDSVSVDGLEGQCRREDAEGQDGGGSPGSRGRCRPRGLTGGQREWLRQLVDGPLGVGAPQGGVSAERGEDVATTGWQGRHVPMPASCVLSAIAEGTSPLRGAVGGLLRAWVRDALARGSVADELLLAACCDAAKAATAAATAAA